MSLLAERPAVELLVGRQLTDSEQAIDVVKLDRALAKAKDELNTAIHEEMLRATLVWITNGGSPRLAVTPDMRAVLDSLYLLGAQEAWLELDRLGYDLQGRRAYIEEAPGPDGDVPDYLRRNLRGIEIRIEDELVRTDLSGLASSAVARAVMQLPGARDLASRAISTAMISGFASTFDQVQDLVGAWQYTAILDGGTCDVCRPLDGRVYDTLEELFRVLPNYGPNPRCFGGGRCRCRAVPMPPDAPAVVEGDPVPLPFEQAVRLPQRSLHGDVLAEIDTAVRAIASLHGVPAATPQIPIRIRNLRGTVAGEYRYTDAGEAVEIVVDPVSPYPAFTLAHELGHWLDHQAVGGTGFASETSSAALAEWLQAIEQTEAVRTLRQWLSNPSEVAHVLPDGTVLPFLPSRDRLRYLLDPAEIFARAYAQWAAIRTGDTMLVAGLNRGRLARYPEQWSDLDFQGVAAVFDKIAKEQGWQL